ncbi:MAG: hypothetical protein FWC89_02235 [Defluviitaleaceae bacterium]|nr:hypothetical protein [Defluviitaleaceae bacterium]
MGDLTTILPSYFGFSGKKATRERGSYLLQTANAIFKIHKTNSSAREIIARYNLLKRLEEAGFSCTDGIMPTTSGTPFVTLGRDTFVMARHIAGRDPDLNSIKDMQLVLESLARFHNAAKGFGDVPPTPPLTEVFAKQSAVLANAVKQVNRRPRLSDFDVLMLKHADFYATRATRAAETLAATDYETLHANALASYSICHNNLKEESLPIFEEACFITRFDEATIDLQLTDIASVLRRYARKSNREIPADRLLEMYNKISPLPSSAKEIIHAQLSFPWPFMKTITQFYSKKRNFTPAGITSRMTDILEEQQIYDAYVNDTLQL